MSSPYIAETAIVLRLEAAQDLDPVLQHSPTVPGCELVLGWGAVAAVAASAFECIGTIDGRGIYALKNGVAGDGHLTRAHDPATPGEAPASGVADPSPAASGVALPPISPARRRCELVEDIYRLTLLTPGQWHSFLQGHLRRNHVERLSELNLDTLLKIQEQAAMLRRHRGQDRTR